MSRSYSIFFVASASKFIYSLLPFVVLNDDQVYYRLARAISSAHIWFDSIWWMFLNNNKNKKRAELKQKKLKSWNGCCASEEHFISMHRFSTVFFFLRFIHFSSFLFRHIWPQSARVRAFGCHLRFAVARGSRGHMALRASNGRLSILFSPYVLSAQLRSDATDENMSPKLPDWIRMRCECEVRVMENNEVAKQTRNKQHQHQQKLIHRTRYPQCADRMLSYERTENRKAKKTKAVTRRRRKGKIIIQHASHLYA